LYYVKSKKNIKVIINNKISEDIVEILLAYGIKKNQILIKPIFENWKIKELVFPDLSYFEVSQDECNFLSKIVKKYTSPVQISYDKIYISRRDSTDSRNLINEIEIEDYLKGKGYKIILLSKLSLSRKIEIFTNAKIIITPLGAGIQNVYFCKKINAKVILIGTSRYFHLNYFLQLSYFKNINLFFIPCVELTSYTNNFGYLHSSFYLDLEILKEASSRVSNY
jgi:capsular polysaccharide biosynthesis protein